MARHSSLPLFRNNAEYSTGKAKGSFTKDNDEKVIDEAGKGLSHQSISKYQTPVYAMRASAFRSQRTFNPVSMSASCYESSDYCKNRNTLTNLDRGTSAIEAAGR